MNEKLSDILIYELTDENDLIIDPFMGMGTTAVSCIKYDRHYFGFEISELYWNECQKRLESEKRKRKNELF
jgi:DNA modification methylase